MASIFAKTGGNLSALTYQKVVASSFMTGMSYGSVHALNTARYSAFTADEAGDMEGAIVCIKYKGVLDDDTFTITLQEYSGGAWADVAGATKTLTTAEVYNEGTGSYPVRGSACWTYFDFATSATIDTNASKWRLKLEGNSSDCQALFSVYYGTGIVLEDSATYNSGDNLFLAKDLTVTIDEDKTFGTIALGTSTKLYVPSTVASSLTFTVANMYWGSHCGLTAGENAGARVPYSNQFYFNLTGTLYLGTGYQSDGAGYELNLWGEKPANYYTYLESGHASGQPTITTKTDMSSDWIAGDVIMVAGRDHYRDGYESMTIQSISGTSITFTANFTNDHFADWVVFNKTRAEKCGVKWCPGIISGALTGWKELNISGVNVVGGTKPDFLCYSYDTEYLNAVPYVWDTVICSERTQFYTIIDTMWANYLKGSSFKDIFVYGYAGSLISAHFQFAGFKEATFSGVYILGILSRNYGTLFILTDCSSLNLDNLQISGNYGSYGTLMHLLRINLSTFNDIKLLGGDNSASFSGAGSVFNRLTTDLADLGSVNLTGLTESKFNDCKFGQDHANGTTSGADIRIINVYFNTVIAKDCSFSTDPIIEGATIQDPNSYFRSHNHNQVANDHRSWLTNGNQNASGDGLTDTTVHTSGTDKFALRFEPLSSTDSLEWEFKVPTGNIQNKTMTVAVWVKINNANYYAGTYQLPRLTIDYDNGTTAYAQATNKTDWQLLFITFTPTTTFGQITVTLSARTDATTTGAYVYIDDFTVLYPAGYKLNLGGLDDWANAMPVTPPIATVLSANDVWTASSTVDYGSDTMGNKVKVLKNASLLIDGEIIV